MNLARLVTHCSISGSWTCAVLWLLAVGGALQLVGLFLAAGIVITIRRIQRNVTVMGQTANVTVSAHNATVITEPPQPLPPWWRRVGLDVKADPRASLIFATLGVGTVLLVVAGAIAVVAPISCSTY